MSSHLNVPAGHSVLRFQAGGRHYDLLVSDEHRDRVLHTLTEAGLGDVSATALTDEGLDVERHLVALVDSPDNLAPLLRYMDHDGAEPFELNAGERLDGGLLQRVQDLEAGAPRRVKVLGSEGGRHALSALLATVGSSLGDLVDVPRLRRFEYADRAPLDCGPFSIPRANPARVRTRLRTPAQDAADKAKRKRKAQKLARKKNRKRR